jgi:hypothetical protein
LKLKTEEKFVVIYLSIKPLRKTFGPVPTRLDKPPIDAE